MEIAGKSALVTGAGAGIGRATALRLATAGASVLVVDLDEDSGRRTVDEITAAGGAAVSVRADVTRDSAVELMVAEAERAFGGLDILVNNAGGYAEPVFPDAPVERWTRHLDLNLRAAMLGIHFAIPAMEKRGGGAVVNVASTAGLGFASYPGPEYAAAKAGLIRLTTALGDLVDRGVRVNCVCPYTVGTDAVRRTIETLRARGDELPAPLRTILLAPEEVAEAAIGLVRDESMTGRLVVLFGGKPPELVPVDAPPRWDSPAAWRGASAHLRRV